MAKLETQTWETQRLSRFEVRVTPKKLYIDRINLKTGESEVAMYIQVQEHWVSGEGKGKKYFASVPFSAWCNVGTTLDSMLRFIKNVFDIEVPEEAIDLFESRNLAREMCGEK